MSWFKKIIVIVLVALVGIQFIPAKRNQSTVKLDTDFSNIYDVPEAIQSKLTTSCYDCHSNNTYYPWYNKIQPITWFLEDHISEGKEELNFSQFGDYSKRRRRNKLKSIVSQIREDEMPLSSYTFIHSNAMLSKKDKDELISWFSELRNNINKK